MAEHLDLCADIRHHRQKVMLFFCAMRSFAKALEKEGYRVHYHSLHPGHPSFFELLSENLEKRTAGLLAFEVVDPGFEAQLKIWAGGKGVPLEWMPSPMFLDAPHRAVETLGEGRPFMANFYRHQRRRHKVLLESDGSPRGGRWTYDDENRRKIPRNHPLPSHPLHRKPEHWDEVRALIEKLLPNHPGSLEHFIWPTTREEALHDLETFFRERFEEFGPFEDALHPHHPTLWHSWISPAMNLGLLTPKEVLDRALAMEDKVPLNSLEGFIRQILGWREFIRAVHLKFGDLQLKSNFFEHHRKLSPSWWSGETGIPPLDTVISKCWDLGYAHHIERLMVLANMMVLCEIEPKEAHRWFMEMFVDSSEWVMGPNVYGMGLFSDGGTFATKPYICSSNYWIKMGAAKKGPWCDVVDGLYWRFIDKHRSFFEGQARMSHAARNLDRMDQERRARIFSKAEAFLSEHTS